VAAADALIRSHGETLIIADSDCVLPKEALIEAVELVRSGKAPWVVPHTLVKRLDREASAHVIAADPTVEPPFKGKLDRAQYTGFAGGGFIVVDASAWQAAGGIPTAFAGWGAEDEATAVILDTLVGPHVRLKHDLWHLWHPHARKGGQTHHHDNRVLFRTLLGMAGDADGMFEMLERLSSGASVTELLRGGNGGVPMVALMDFMRGTEVIKRGQRFLAKDEEAKRHAARPRKIAVRVDSLSAHYASQLSNDRTLELRSEQHIRNIAVMGMKKP
jgi:hypothetical protein